MLSSAYLVARNLRLSLFYNFGDLSLCVPAAPTPTVIASESMPITARSNVRDILALMKLVTHFVDSVQQRRLGR